MVQDIVAKHNGKVSKIGLGQEGDRKPASRIEEEILQAIQIAHRPDLPGGLGEGTKVLQFQIQGQVLHDVRPGERNGRRGVRQGGTDHLATEPNGSVPIGQRQVGSPRTSGDGRLWIPRAGRVRLLQPQGPGPLFRNGAHLQPLARNVHVKPCPFPCLFGNVPPMLFRDLFPGPLDDEPSGLRQRLATG